MAIPKNTLYTDTAGRRTGIGNIPATLNHTAWQRRGCGIGTKGFRVYDWTLLDSDRPGHQYMIRRSIDDGELAYYHCFNPGRAGFGELVNVAGARWPIEEVFGASKNEVGLDQYQVRKYEAWHRHITLAMLAHSFLAVTASKAKKRAQNQSATPNQRHHRTDRPRRANPPTPDEAHPRRNTPTTQPHPSRPPERNDITFRLHWSLWRRRHQTQARRTHYRRRLAPPNTHD